MDVREISNKVFKNQGRYSQIVMELIASCEDHEFYGSGDQEELKGDIDMVLKIIDPLRKDDIEVLRNLLMALEG